LVSTWLKIVRHRPVGRNGEHRLLTVGDADGAQAPVIWWDGGQEELPAGRIDLAYTARASDYRGEPQVEVAWIDARPSLGAAPAEIAPVRAPIEVVDFRQEPRPHRILEELRLGVEPAVWREGPAAAEIPGADRYSLPPANGLAVWTAPPGPAELHAALARVAPARVYLFGLDPGLDRSDALIQRLAGLVKHSLRAYDGRTTLASLAAATAQREATVLAALEWLVARGSIRMEAGESGALHLEGIPAAEPKPLVEAEIVRARARFEALLAETAAYRAFFRNADADTLVSPL
jgi:hypothetical protein